VELAFEVFIISGARSSGRSNFMIVKLLEVPE
jgi:hypothetical protein